MSDKLTDCQVCGAIHGECTDCANVRLTAENKELDELSLADSEAYLQIMDVRDGLTAHNAALVGALEFYADSTNHRASWAHSDVPSSAGLGGPSRISSLVERDCGTKARTALERGDEQS